MSSHTLDSGTPVLVGAGQASDRPGTLRYRSLSAVDLAAAAACEALLDTGRSIVSIAAAIDTVAGVRQFEISAPGIKAPLGKSDNYPRSVARRLGANPHRAVLEVVGGQSPQHLVSELAAAIAAGRCEVALAFGSEAISTARHFADAEDKPDFTEHVDGNLDDRGFGLDGLLVTDLLNHGLMEPAAQYALFENARRARLGLSREKHAQSMGELFAPFTRVAANNPHASAPTERSATELITPTSRNRPIADPYPRYLVARDQVNQGAAVLLMSVGAAERLGVARDRWVFLHGHADLRDRELLDRNDLSLGAASIMAARHALEVAGIGVADLTTLDLYSCFPIAVFNICDGLGLAPDDPRGLTVTGGLPFFGGAGNNYSMHAIAETVSRLRADPGAYGLVGANGGHLSKYSVGVYSTDPVAWRPDDSARLQEEINAWAAPVHVSSANGPATIETYTVKHDRTGHRTGIIVGVLEDGGQRFLATTDTDESVLDLLSDGEPIGAAVHVTAGPAGNHVTTYRGEAPHWLPGRKW